MSNFNCEICGKEQIDSDHGFVSGCQHHPPEHKRFVNVHFGGDKYATAFYDNGWYKSAKAKANLRAVHPISWKE